MIKISFSNALPKTVTAHVVFMTEEAKPAGAMLAISKASGGALDHSLKAADFKAEKKKFHIFRGHAETADTVIVGGLGKLDKLDKKDFEILGSALFKTLEAAGVKKAVVDLDAIKGHDMGDAVSAMAYGALLNSYRFDKYKSKKKKDDQPKPAEILFVTKDASAAKKRFAEFEKIAAGVFFTRDLVWEPANELYPESFAKRVKDELAPLGVKVKIVNQAQMQKLGMGSLLSVGLGSARDSYMVIMEWNGTGASKNKKAAPVALVGKGVTFDTGGISLKPGAGMWDMKWDMGGAGAVVGAMKAIAGRKAKAHVVGAIGLVENMPSDRATRPGDVVTSMSGQTVEILNTDAEGRLVLADVLTYVQKNHDPALIIDLATLTGAIIIALGHEFAGAFTNDEKCVEDLVRAGEKTGDRVWHMPLADGWDKALDSDIADIKNISLTRDGGSATAAAFLKRFIDDGRKWVHLDIAGMAWSGKAQDSRPKGGTGYGVRLLDEYVRQTAG